MDARNHELLSARAEFYLCLARAFMTPRDPQTVDALRDALPDDLADLAAELGLDIGGWLTDYRAQAARLPDASAWLQTYSAIFLAPPVPVPINVGHYLDGAIDGGSVREMEAAYRHCGVERDEGFRDLSDHVSVQLEFVALLYASQARCSAGDPAVQALPVDPGEFLDRFARRWAGPWCDALQRVAAERELDANPYLPLSRILQRAVELDAVAPEVDPKATRRQRALERARSKAAERGITEDDLAEIRRKLEQRGLSTTHLSVPPDQRDQWLGLGHKGDPGRR